MTSSGQWGAAERWQTLGHRWELKVAALDADPEPHEPSAFPSPIQLPGRCWVAAGCFRPRCSQRHQPSVQRCCGHMCSLPSCGRVPSVSTQECGACRSNERLSSAAGGSAKQSCLHQTAASGKCPRGHQATHHSPPHPSLQQQHANRCCSLLKLQRSLGAAQAPYKPRQAQTARVHKTTVCPACRGAQWAKSSVGSQGAETAGPAQAQPGPTFMQCVCTLGEPHTSPRPTLE